MGFPLFLPLNTLWNRAFGCVHVCKDDDNNGMSRANSAVKKLFSAVLSAEDFTSCSESSLDMCISLSMIRSIIDNT